MGILAIHSKKKAEYIAGTIQSFDNEVEKIENKDYNINHITKNEEHIGS